MLGIIQSSAKQTIRPSASDTSTKPTEAEAGLATSSDGCFEDVDLTKQGNEMACTNDTPVSDKELDALYGKDVTPHEFEHALENQGDAYNDDDLMNDCYDLAASLNKLLKANNIAAAGSLMAAVRKNTITRRAEAECYGTVTTPLFEVTA